MKSKNNISLWKSRITASNSHTSNCYSEVQALCELTSCRPLLVSAMRCSWLHCSSHASLRLDPEAVCEMFICCFCVFFFSQEVSQLWCVSTPSPLWLCPVNSSCPTKVSSTSSHALNNQSRYTAEYKFTQATTHRCINNINSAAATTTQMKAKNRDCTACNASLGISIHQTNTSMCSCWWYFSVVCKCIFLRERKIYLHFYLFI